MQNTGSSVFNSVNLNLSLKGRGWQTSIDIGIHHFHPQSGGQPYDTGFITNTPHFSSSDLSDFKFIVEDVRSKDGIDGFKCSRNGSEDCTVKDWRKIALEQMYQSLNETEAAEDDTELVKHIGQSCRFSAVKAKREEKIKTAHDEAMFGALSLLPSVDTDIEVEEDSNKKKSTETASATSLTSDQLQKLLEKNFGGCLWKKFFGSP